MNLSAIYDLAVSPPTYDFLSFLVEAEKARLAGGYPFVDVFFQPGPKAGFRDDKLPPNLEAREGMLRRICVAACSLLPSVGSVFILRSSANIQGRIFPKNWRQTLPVSHYGVQYQINAPRVLRATDIAREQVRRWFKKPYITFTYRNCDYWPDRNSNSMEWTKASRWASEHGYQVVHVDDTEDSDKIWSWDIDMRLALYEKALVNLGVVNGPMMLNCFAETRYLMFKPITPSTIATTEAYLAERGLLRGDQYGTNGKLIWADDDAATIIHELEKFLNEQKEEKYADGFLV
jgi:hypothetical protein